jgi:predicted nucleic acid-binding protein
MSSMWSTSAMTSWRAAQLACSWALRGYDAVHCACAERLRDDDLIVAANDRRLLAACMSLGMATADITAR